MTDALTEKNECTCQNQQGGQTMLNEEQKRSSFSTRGGTAITLHSVFV